jgi:anaerobic selenocysteine-containing dehydrogenase
MLPESETVAQALRSREFTVVVDSFLTDTARCAHLVLPVATMLEEEDVVGAYGHHYVGNVRPVVPPLPGAKTDYEIVQALAGRVGLGDLFRQGPRQWKEKLLAKQDGLTIKALEANAVRSPFAKKVLFADRKFPTATGRMNLIHRIAAEAARPTAERPLLLMAISTDRAQGSQTQGEAGLATVTVHPAVAPGLGDGDSAWLESDLGRLQVEVRLDARQRRDVALMTKGGGLQAGRCANVLVPAQETDAGGGAVYYDTPVGLSPIHGAEARPLHGCETSA